MIRCAISVFSIGLLFSALFQMEDSPAGQAPARYRVSGIVSLDGEKLPEGEIVFQDPNEKEVIAVPVKNGRYELVTSPGVKKVMIAAWKADPGESKLASVVMDLPRVQYLPSCYNTKTMLAASIHQARTEFHFHLESRTPGERRK